jgi:hypothetical protein
MRLERNVRFDGNLGKHEDSGGRQCPGRDFKPEMVGLGGVYTNPADFAWLN